MRTILTVLTCVVMLTIIVSDGVCSNPFNHLYDDSWWNDPVSGGIFPGGMLDPYTNDSDPELMFFRRVITLDQDPTSASISITADNLYCVSLYNSQFTHSDWCETDTQMWDTETYDLSNYLVAGPNVIGIIAYDTGGINGTFAEVIVDGDVVAHSNDGGWKSLSMSLHSDIANNPFNHEYGDYFWNTAEYCYNPVIPNAMWDPYGNDQECELAIYRRVVTLDSAPQSAQITVTADNIYQYSIYNSVGQTFYDSPQADGDMWTYETFDVTSQLVEGWNTINLLTLDADLYQGAYFELVVDGTTVASSWDGGWTSLQLPLYPIANGAEWQSDSVDFGTVFVGETVSMDVTLANRGSLWENYTFSVPQPFSIVDPVDPILVSPGQQTTVQVEFAPVSAGEFAGQLIADNGSGTTVSIPVSGTALNSLEVTINPYSPVILLPSTGGEFYFDVSVSNDAPVPVSIDIWASATHLGSGHTWNLRSYPITVGAGSTWNYYEITQEVPANAPAGEYEYSVQVGEYTDIINGSDTIVFNKQSGGGGGRTFASWETGWGHGELDQNLANSSLIPATSEVASVYPNPFNATTTLQFSLVESGKVNAAVYNITGQLVAEVTNAYFSQGTHRLAVSLDDVPSGVYFLHTKASGQLKDTQKIILIR